MPAAARPAVVMYLLGAAILAAAPPFPPTTVPLKDAGTLADVAAAYRAAGLDLDPSAADAAAKWKAGPTALAFWERLEVVARQTGHRLDVRNAGRKVALVKADGPAEPSSVAGPFRVYAREVAGRLDLATGRRSTDVLLEAHWEPRVAVFRLSSPTVTAATDDAGNKLFAPAESAKSPVAGASSHALPVRLTGVPRTATRIATLDGHFTATASERMLPFAFDLGAKRPTPGVLPPGVPAAGVTATLAAFEKAGNQWEAVIDLTYPPGLPAFESFETWLGENRCRLVGPDKVAVEPADYELPAPGVRMTVAYRFDAKAVGGATPGKGWSLVYDTPSPPAEVRVPFTLRDVPLP